MICFCGFGLWVFFFEILGKKMLVPLTASLYVPGTLDDADKVLVDIGTGYFVEVSWLQLAAFFFLVV
jgi:prefoldin alpha subunit